MLSSARKRGAGMTAQPTANRVGSLRLQSGCGEIPTRDERNCRLPHGASLRRAPYVHPRPPPSASRRTRSPYAGTACCNLVGKGNKPATMPITVPVLRAWEACRGERTTGRLILRPLTGNPIDRRDAYRMVARIAKSAGIPRHISRHSLRHAAITRLGCRRPAPRCTDPRSPRRAAHHRPRRPRPRQPRPAQRPLPHRLRCRRLRSRPKPFEVTDLCVTTPPRHASPPARRGSRPI